MKCPIKQAHRFLSFKLTFFFFLSNNNYTFTIFLLLDNYNYTFTIANLLYTRKLKTQFYHFIILSKELCRNNQQKVCVTRFSLFLQVRLFINRFPLSMITLSTYWVFICQHLAPTRTLVFLLN